MTTENPTNKRDTPVKRANKTLTKARNRCQTRINGLKDWQDKYKEMH